MRRSNHATKDTTSLIPVEQVEQVIRQEIGSRHAPKDRRHLAPEDRAETRQQQHEHQEGLSEVSSAGLPRRPDTPAGPRGLLRGS